MKQARIYVGVFGKTARRTTTLAISAVLLCGSQVTGGSAFATASKVADARAISGGDLRAISGGDRRAISGGDLRAISGGDRRAISGGDRRAISGGDLRAISGGDLRAISGGDRRAMVTADLRVLGPVDYVEYESGKLVILGQNFSLRSHSAFVKGLREKLAVGEVPLIAAYTEHGSKEVRLVDTGETYVAGATRVWLRGEPAAIDPSVATLEIGQATVDLSQVLGRGAGASLKSKNILITGVQPSRGGIVLADGAQ
jgi:hypothetical protein